MATQLESRSTSRLVNTFACNLRALRIKAGMTQADLFLASGVPQGTLSRLERGERFADLAQIAVIAEALRVDPVRLLR